MQLEEKKNKKQKTKTKKKTKTGVLWDLSLKNFDDRILV